MPAGAGGVDYASIRMMSRELGMVPIELRKELRPRIRAAGDRLRKRIQSNASWSSRIPGAVRMTTSFASKTGGIRIFVNQAAAPEARPLENRGQAGTFRHPVYGHRSTWVSQAARPFFLPAIQAEYDNVRTAVEDAVRASFPKGSL